MSSGKKSPRFFCDNCGAEVPPKTSVCPGCGRYFSSVRCPECGFSADEALFKSGCPSCGYSAPADTAPKKPAGKQNYSWQKKSYPFWVYFVAISVVTGILSAIIFMFI